MAVRQVANCSRDDRSFVVVLASHVAPVAGTNEAWGVSAAGGKGNTTDIVHVVSMHYENFEVQACVWVSDDDGFLTGPMARELLYHWKQHVLIAPDFWW